MKSLAEIYQNHCSQNAGGDKGTIHSYIEVYEALLAPYRENTNVLEIGIAYGHSLLMWKDYFVNSNIYGIEIDKPGCDHMKADPRFEGLHIINENVDNHAEMLAHLEGINFDVIIDDGSHVLRHQTASYHVLKHKLNPDGIYIIEDVDNIDLWKGTYHAIRDHYQYIDNTKQVDIIDLREIKGRFDDVMVVIQDK